MMIDPYNKSGLESAKSITMPDYQYDLIVTNENNHDPNDPNIAPYLASVYRQ